MGANGLRVRDDHILSQCGVAEGDTMHIKGHDREAIMARQLAQVAEIRKCLSLLRPALHAQLTKEVRSQFAAKTEAKPIVAAMSEQKKLGLLQGALQPLVGVAVMKKQQQSMIALADHMDSIKDQHQGMVEQLQRDFAELRFRHQRMNDTLHEGLTAIQTNIATGVTEAKVS